jgi:hypothetical protein
MFVEVACPSTNNVFGKLRCSLKAKLIGFRSPAHILNNCLQHGMDTLDLVVQSVVLKIYNYFSVCTVITESLKEF